MAGTSIKPLQRTDGALAYLATGSGLLEAITDVPPPQ